MAYLGNNLQVAYKSYKIIDDISSSFNSSLTSFPLQVGGVAPVPFPINPQQCLISVNGVVQEPDPTGTNGFKFSGNNIVFASAPTTGHSFFGVILAGADYVNVGVNYPSGSVSTPSITFDTDLDTGIYNPAANELGFVTNSNDAVRIDSSGQVGIGTTNIETKLHVRDDSSSYPLLIQNRTNAVSTSGIALIASSSDFSDGQYASIEALSGGAGSTAHQLLFRTCENGGTSTEKLRIDTAGRLLVGTNSALAVGGSQHLFQAESVSEIPNGASFIRHNETAAEAGAVITLGRSRGTSAGAVTAVANGDTLGYIIFSGANGTDYSNNAAWIRCEVDGETFTLGDTTDLPGRLVFSTTANGAGSPTERMRIDSFGRVGIGTTSPSYALDVLSQDGIRLIDAQSLRFLRLIPANGTESVPAKINNSSTLGLNIETDGDLTFKNANGTTEYVRIDSSGSVGIGTASPNERLEIVDDSDADVFSGIKVLSNNQAAYVKYGWRGIDGIDQLRFSVGETERVRIDNSGRVGIGTTNPTQVLDCRGSLALYQPSTGTDVRLRFANTNNSCSIGVADTTNSVGLAFYPTAAEAARIDSSGKLLVGTTTGSAAIQAGDAAPSSTEQCWAANTDAAYVITKSNLSTGTTTPLFTLTTGGIGGANVLNNRRGILEIFLDVLGDDPYDSTGAGYYVSAYKHGRSFNGLTASIAQVSATQASVTQNMTVTVSGNVATYNVVFGGFAPNHTIQSVTAYIRCIHKGLTIAAA